MSLQPYGLVSTLDTTGDEIVPGLTRQQYEFDRQRYDDAVIEYARAQEYYAGEQYEKENDELSVSAGYTAANKRMPEHLRKHAYSSHIQEAIDILADMFASGIKFEGPHSVELNKWWKAGEMESRIDDWFREALITGQSYATPVFDADDDSMDADFWQADEMWPVYRRQNYRELERLYRFEQVDDIDGQRELVHVFLRRPMLDEDGEVMFRVDVDTETISPVMQIVEYVLDEQLEIYDVVSHAVPDFEVVHGRGDTRRKVRSSFGDTMITKKVRGTADRFNALGQLGFRVARQNSFATIGVVGDQALLGAGSRDDGIAKDVADVLRFPGGTDLKPITLPTDPRMIESQQRLLEKNLYREFGLTKIDMEDIGGLGTVSGYALEVLNRKDRATHQRVRKNAISAIRTLANRMLDIHAYRMGEAEGRDWWDVDPLERYPDRAKIEVVIGSGDIVDAVGDREDYEAGIVSRRFVLRRKGLDKTDIDTIESEVQSEARFQTQLGTEAARATADQQAETQSRLQAEHAQQQIEIERAKPTPSTQTGTTQRST
jgi:hypothetical protein